MRKKIGMLLLTLSLTLCGLMAWTHLRRIDLESQAHVLEAEKIRHDYVISHDFGLLKEKLIESHRDHWTYYAQIEQEARWEFGGTILIGLLIIILLFLDLRSKRVIAEQSKG